MQQQEYRRLESMVDYCKTDRCLRCSILDYFGQSHGDGCDGCANCRDAFETVDITKQAQMILACVRRIRDKLGYSVGAATVARVLQGSREKKLLQLGLDTVSTYGLMKQTGRSTIRAMMEHLEREGYLLTEQEHQTQQLTEAASRVLFHGEQVFMRRRKEEEQKEDASPMQGLRDLQADLYEQLRALRAELAREGGIPPFMIFSNATLTDMARRQPVTESAFRKVSGVGEIKAAWYAKPFLACIRDFLKEQGQE